MKIFTKPLAVVFALTVFFTASVSGQSILNPADSVYTYNANATLGTPTNPNGPAGGVIGKWCRTVRMSWNTNEWKAYIINGIPFRLKFPKSYNPTANDGKLYPMLIFWHGAGEVGPVHDNELSLANGGQFFTSSVDNGAFDGYILILQAPANGWDNHWLDDAKIVCDYMVGNNKLDGFRIGSNGLSAGGEGSWAMQLRWPQYLAANLPMSGINLGEGTTANINLFRFTRTWDFQGGLDTSPDPNTAGNVALSIWAAGGNYKYTLYPTLGHGTWNTVWAEPNFWPFIDSSYMSNPWTLFGQTAFCPGTTINVTIGVAPGMDAYQWRMNGAVISSATTNAINVTQLGTYDCRVQRNGVWSDWSHVPVVISIKQPTVTPPISISGIMSDAIPDGSGKTYVNLQVPDSGYNSYTWKKVGSNAVVDTNRIFKATQPGQYIVSVTQPLGCSSIYSAPFTVINAAGSNAPSPAAGLLATPLSFTQAQLNWTRNPNPVNPEVAFEIYRATTSGGPYTYVGQAKADSVQYVDKGLTANTKYYYVVRAIDSTAAAALSNESAVTTTSDKTPPTAPSNLKLPYITSNSASLIWNQSTDNVGVVNYYVYINGVKSYTNPVGDTTFTVYELVPQTQYTFFVTAVDASGNESIHSNQVTGASVNNGLVYNYYTTATAWSVLPNFSTLTPAFSGVMPNVSTSNTTQSTNYGYTWSGTIKITVAGTYTFATTSDDGSALWFNATSATGTPLVNNDGGHASTTKTGTITLKVGSYPIFVEYFQGGGGANMSLTWACPQLYGNNNQVAIPNSAFASTFSGGTVPARPTVVTATPISYKQVNITWVDNSNNETGFEVYRSTSLNSVFSILGTTAAGATSFTDSTVQAATTYFYRVQAVNQNGGSGFDSLSTGGLAWSYYTFDGSWTKMPNFNTLTPVATGNASNVSLSPALATTNFALKFQGFINIKTQGSYTFYTSSDDGSDLYVGGYDSAHLVVKNDFLQGTTERSGTVTLSPGKYPFFVTYFQEGGGEALTASYAGPGITKTLFPDSVFYNKQSIATTAALPALPAAPTGLTATAVSSSVVNLGWVNNATNATGIQLYRSASDSLHYVLLSTLAATATSYSDTGLFTNTIYYYKIRSANDGGNSAYTPKAAATTLNIKPVISKLASQSARYGTTTVIPVSASSVNSGALNLTAFNLPAFASFTDNHDRTGSLTVTPSAANQGLYTGLYITVTDAFGGSDTTTFSLSVNNNYAPTIDTIVNYTINENDTLSIPMTGHDVNTSDTLTLAASNLPGGSTVTQVSNGVATLFLHPGYAAAGVYNITATVNDNNGLSASRNFVLTIKDKDPSVKIYARFNGGDAIGSPWNNITGPVSTNFVDANGNPTTLGISLSPSSWYNAFNGGPSTGNNSGVYPDAVLQDYYYFAIFGGPSVVNATLTGADSTKHYNLTFFSSSVWNGVPNNGTTTFTVGGQTQSLYVQNNLQNTVTFSNINPTGTIIPFQLGVTAGTPAGFVNSIVITQSYDDGTVPAAPSSLQAQIVPGAGVSLTWTDVAYNESNYLVYRSTGDSTHFALIATLPVGSSAYTDSSATGNTLNYYRVGAINTHGSSAYSNYVWVNTPDRIPQVAPIANVNVNNTQSLQVNVTASDDATDHLTLTASGLPSFVTFTDNGNGTGVINIQPTAGLQGTFTGVTITATDLADSSRSTNFTINVLDPNLQYTYVHFANPGFMAPAPWNNFVIPYIPYATMNMANLADQTGANTGITMTLTDGWDNFGYTGMKRRNGSDLYPENVSYNSLFTTSTSSKRITLSGLDVTKAYNIQFYSSHNTSQSTLTNFTINGKTVSLNGSENSNKTAQINGALPDASGNLVITIAKDASATFAQLNSIVIEAYTPGNVTPFSPADLRVLDFAKSNTVALQWQDRASNETGYEVWRANDGGTYSLLKSLPAGATSYSDSGLANNIAYNYVVRAVNGSNKSAFSNPVRGYTYATTVFINLNNSNSPNPGAPWNSLNWNYRSLGVTWNNFRDELGATTNIGLYEPMNWDEVETNGYTTGTGIFPDKALVQSFLNFVGDSSYLVIQGLDCSKTYDFVLMGSCTDAATQNATSKYYMGGKMSMLQAQLNNTGTVTMFGITPDQNGNVNLGVSSYDSSNSAYSMIGVIIIKGYNSSKTAISQPPVSAQQRNTAVTATASAFVNTPDSVPTRPLTAYPNPFDQFFTLSVPAKFNDDIMVSMTDVSGKVVYMQRFSGLNEGDNYIRIQPTTSLVKGVYFVKVMYANKDEQKVFKVIKR